jgi:hypothetical protein
MGFGRSQSLQDKFPKTDVFSYIELAEGRIWLLPSGIECFCGDLPAAEQKLVWAAQDVPDVNLFNLKDERAAWKSKPSWYIVGKRSYRKPRVGTLRSETHGRHDG